MMQSLMEQYLNKVKQHEIIKDDAQLKVISALQEVLNHLQPRSWRPSFMRSPRGVFLWGDVGVGKTWMMDQFYQMVPGAEKQRYHYHDFMEMLHHRMAEHKNQVNPLLRIADDLAKSTRLICIDEFNVPEIADAMLLYGILEGLFKNRIMLVTTSNYAPDKLYEKGFQREIFSPAIELLKSHNDVIEVESYTDYRILNSEAIIPHEQLLQPIHDLQLENIFQQLTTGTSEEEQEIVINHRPLPVIKVAEGVIWLDYREICSNPRATRDYIELSKRFSAVIISNINALSVTNESLAWRFIRFVDELYDGRIQLVVSTLETLIYRYQNEALRFQFARTISRLYEMQSSMVHQGYIDTPTPPLNHQQAHQKP